MMPFKVFSFLQVVPNGESFETDYTGIFKFNFWYFGKYQIYIEPTLLSIGRWTEVVVDDLLPVHEGYVSPLIFAR